MGKRTVVNKVIKTQNIKNNNVEPNLIYYSDAEIVLK